MSDASVAPINAQARAKLQQAAYIRVSDKMALFEIVLQGRYANQEIINRWNYVGSGTPASVSLSFGLVSAFGAIAAGEPPVLPAGSLLAKIRAIQSIQMDWLQVICMNIYDVTDFYTTALPDNTLGTDGGFGLSPTITAGFRTNLVRRDIARGTKRFSGVPNGAQLANGDLNSTYLTAMATLATAMSTNLTYDDEGNSLTYAPCVVSKLKYTTPSGKFAYKYYPTLVTQMEHVAQGILWESYSNTRTQTSRQVGKGA